MADSERVTWKTALGLAALVVGVGSAQQWWSARQAGSLGAELVALAKPGDIRMLSSETCAPCQLARQWLVAQKVPFSECIVERDSACRAEHQARGQAGTPMLIVRGQAQLGFSPEAVKLALQRSAAPLR